MRTLLAALILSTLAAAQQEVSLDQFGGDLRAAISAVQAPGVVRVPAGDWPQAFGPIELPTDISLQGAGARVSRLSFPGPGLVLPDGSRRQEIRSLALLGPITWSSPERAGIHLVRGVRSVVIRDTYIRGWDIGIRITHSWSVILDHVVLNNHASTAVKMEDGVNCVTLRDCEIGLCQLGVAVNGAANCVQLIGGRVEGVARGVAFGPKCHGGRIAGVYFENLSDYAVLAQGPSQTIENCMLNGYYAQGPVVPVLIKLVAEDKQRCVLTLRSNRFRNATVGIQRFGRWKIGHVKLNEWESSTIGRPLK